MKRKEFWLLHYGTENTGNYALFRKQPLVTKRMVKDADTKKLIPLYEANGFVFNFCKSGTETWVRIRIPLGSMVKISIGLESGIVHAQR